MSNFTSANPSIDAGLTAWGQYGGMVRSIGWRLASGTTAATATSGYISCQRMTPPLTIPTVGTGVQGYCLTMGDIWTNASCLNFLCLEYVLGVITLNGNVFSGSASMPTKTILGTSITTATNLAFLVATTAGVATTPTITITYTNQDGTASQTASLTLPTSPAVNTAFYINPLLANGDTGIRTVTNISSSVTTGNLVLKVYGCLIIGHSVIGASANPHGSIEPLITPTQALYNCAATEAVNLYRAGTASAVDSIVNLAFCPETT